MHFPWHTGDPESRGSRLDMAEHMPNHAAPSRSGGGSRSYSEHASRHQAAEQRRRTRINERLDLLRKLVPHAERANTATFLEEVIKCVHNLKARVAELETEAKERGLIVDSMDLSAHPEGLQGKADESQDDQSSLMNMSLGNNLQHMLQMQQLLASTSPLGSNPALIKQCQDALLGKPDTEIANSLLWGGSSSLSTSSGLNLSVPPGSLLSMGLTLQQLQQSQLSLLKSGEAQQPSANRSPSRLSDLATQLGISSQSMMSSTPQQTEISLSDTLGIPAPGSRDLRMRMQQGVPSQSPASGGLLGNLPSWPGALGAHPSMCVEASKQSALEEAVAHARRRSGELPPTPPLDLSDPPYSDQPRKKRKGLVL